MINKFTGQDKGNCLIFPDPWGRHPALMHINDRKECFKFQEFHLPAKLHWKDIILFSEDNCVATGLRHIIAEHERIKLASRQFKDIRKIFIQQSHPALLIMINDGVISPARFISAVFQAIIYRPESPLLIISEECSRTHELLKNAGADFILLGMRENSDILRATLAAVLKKMLSQNISSKACAVRAELYDSVRSAKKEKIIKNIKITKAEHEASRRLFKKLNISDKYTQMVFLSVL